MKYYTFVWNKSPEDLDIQLNELAEAGWRLQTVRRIQEKPFALLVIMKQAKHQHHGGK